jgi:crossover junction endodeoxyribonuclease RusA
MSEPIRLELPWPPAQLSPNARVGWQTKARATKAYRNDCMWVAYAYRNRKKFSGDPLPEFGAAPVTVTPVFYTRTRQRMDIDNLVASIKSALDGLTGAGYWADDSQVSLGAPRREIDPTRDKCVVLEISTQDPAT